jgi:Phosphodiester glycosidase
MGSLSRMKRLLAIALSALLTVHGSADWRVTERTSLAARPGLEFGKIRCASQSVSTVLHIVRFSAKTHGFVVLDDPEKTFDLGSAAQKRGTPAAVNGGYFHADRTPLGLVVRQGQILHPLEKAKLLSGLVVVTRDRMALVRVGEFKLSPAVLEALQAGPFLVDEGKPVVGLNALRPAARTFVFTQGADRFGFGVCEPVTLAEIGQILATPGLLPGGAITRALNLDGGSSTGLWVAAPEPFYLREGKDVRNFLGVLPR